MRACHSGSSEARAMSTPMRRIRSGCCCACVASGQVAAAPPKSVMNSRRLIASPEAQDTASYRLKPALGKAASGRCRCKLGG